MTVRSNDGRTARREPETRGGLRAEPDHGRPRTRRHATGITRAGDTVNAAARGGTVSAAAPGHTVSAAVPDDLVRAAAHGDLVRALVDLA